MEGSRDEDATTWSTATFTLELRISNVLSLVEPTDEYERTEYMTAFFSKLSKKAVMPSRKSYIDHAQYILLKS